MAKNSLTNGQEGALDRSARVRINHNFSDVSLATSQLDITSSTTFTNIPGMVTEALRPNMLYKFKAIIPMICTANNGSKFCFKQSVSGLISAIEYEAKQMTASALAVSRGTTITDQTAMADNASSVVVLTEIMGVILTGNVVGGTLQLQATQHTSNSDTLSVFKYAQMQFEEIATD